MVIVVLSGFVLALVAPWLHRLCGRWTGWGLALLPLGFLIYLGAQVDEIAAGEVLRTAYAWMPTFAVGFSFRLDGLSLLFALVISGIGALILIYSGGYLAEDRYLGRFYGLLLLFMASMLGLVLADNVITLYVFWELTSISSYLLIGFEHDRESARSAALQALLVTSGGGLAMLAGLVLLGQVGGSMNLSDLAAQGTLVRDHGLYLPILLLILLGAFTKSAQFPFHAWLPAAMAAPTPVSAYLHSATMVKAGVYLLARLHPVLGGTSEWFYLVTSVGTVTMLVGGYLAVLSTDLKRILAYSTISALGTMVLLIGLGDVLAIKGAIVFLLAHALYKGALFMVAGTVDHETGTRNADELGGLWRAMPVTATAATLAALSLASLGPFVSFVGKELFLEAVWESAWRSWLAPAGVVGGALFVVVAAIVGFRVFFGRAHATPKPPHEAPPSFWLGPMVLALASLVLGLFPDLISKSIVAPSMAAVLHWSVPYPEQVKLALWHGINPALILSATSIVLGLLLYAAWHPLRALNRPLAPVLNHGPDWWYDRGFNGLFALAAAQTRVFQNGYLRYYLIAVVFTLIALVGYALAGHFSWQADLVWLSIRPYEAGLAGLIVLAALTTVLARTRVAAVIALGVVGYGVALVFLLFGAPDLAMTQFMIETLTVILFVFVLYRLPRFERFSVRGVRVRDATIAAITGGLITVLVLAALHVPHRTPISDYFAEKSYPEAHGRNIVNVILVDFRSLDTLGEITVLGASAAGIYALLKLRLARKEDQECPP